jgi:hypothetical protein
LGVVLVPALRALLARGKAGRRAEEAEWAVALARREAKRRAGEALWAVALALTGFGALGAALLAGASVTDVVAAPHAEEINGWVLGAVIAVVLGTPIVGIPALAANWVGRFVRAPWSGLPALLIASAAAVAAGVLSVQWVLDGLGDTWWQTVGGVLALASGPVLAVRLLVRRAPRGPGP